MKLKLFFVLISGLFSVQSFSDYSVHGLSVPIKNSVDSMMIYGNQIHLYRDNNQLQMFSIELDRYLERASAEYMSWNNLEFLLLSVTGLNSERSNKYFLLRLPIETAQRQVEFKVNELKPIYSPNEWRMEADGTLIAFSTLDVLGCNSYFTIANKPNNTLISPDSCKMITLEDFFGKINTTIHDYPVQ